MFFFKHVIICARILPQSSNLEPLAGADQMYRLRLFSARCKLYAFRYFHPPQKGESGDANVAIAKDAASVTKDALAEYLYKITEPTNVIKRKILLKALKGVSYFFVRL